MAMQDRRRGPTGVLTWHVLRGLVLVALLVSLPPLAVPDEKDGAKGDASGAAQWRAASAGLEARGISCLQIHPKDREVLWAHVHGLGPARSTDGGHTWEVRLDGVAEKDRPGLRSEVRISLDPSDEKMMYLTIDGQIYRSENSGASWTSITSGALTSLSWDNLRHTHLSWEVRVDSKKSVHLLVGTRNDGDHHGGLYESTNGGKSWEELAGSAQADSGLGNDTFFVRMNPSSDKFVVVAGRAAVWWSDSRGRKFKRNDPGEPGIHEIRGFSDFSGKNLYLADARGIWRSKDGGKRWDKTPIVAGDAIAAVVDPHSKKRLYAIFYDRGVEMSEDARNDKWVAWGEAAEEGGETAPAGLRGQMIREIHIQPRDRHELVYASPLTGLWRSTDGGKTVTAVVAPNDAAAGTVIPVTMPSMAFAAVHPAEDYTHLAVTDEGLVFRSKDRGDAWAAVGPLGMRPEGLVPDVAKGSWLANGRRVMRSTDDGDTWSVLWPPEGAKPPVDVEERVVAVHRSVGKDGVAGTLHILLERAGAVWTSDDDGATWMPGTGPKFPSSETWAAGLAVDPATPDHLVIAARTTQDAPNARDENGGIFESWDGGKTWADVTGDLRPDKRASADDRNAKMNWNHARAVFIDRDAGLILYAADRRGLFARALGDAESNAKTLPLWVEVTPIVADGPVSVPAEPTFSALAHGRTGDGSSSWLVTQLRGRNDETALVAITGAELRALAEASAATLDVGRRAEARQAHPWTVMASPGVGLHLSSLQGDAGLPGRLIGTERSGTKGVVIYEVPGSRPGASKTDEPKKDEPKKDEPKKDEPKKDEPKKGEPAKVPAPLPTVPEGMRAFTSGQDRTWRIWALDKGESTGQVLGHENAVRCVALAPDETAIVTCSDDRTIRFWDAANGKPIATISAEAGVRDVAFDAESVYLYAAGGDSKQVLQIELATRAMKAFQGHKGAVLCVATTEDGGRAYSGGDDHVILVWDTQKGTEVNSIIYGAPVQALAVSRDGAHIYAAGDGGAVAAFDAAGKPTGRLEGLAASARALALERSGETLYAAAPDGVLAIDTKTMTVRMKHAAPGSGGITCVGTSADGVWIVAGDAQGGFWLWAKGHADSFRPRVQQHEGAILAVALTTEETDFATAPVAPAPGGDGPPPKDDGEAKKDDPKAGEAGKEEPPKEAPPGEAPPKEDPPKDAPKDAPPAKDG